jgi:PTS system nitrogen regulatory IIA component
MGSGFLDLKQAAALLHMDALELKHFAQREEVPSQKRGDDFFFDRRLLDEWAQRRMIEISPKQLTYEHSHAMNERSKSSGEVHVADLIFEAAIAPFLTAKNRGGVLRDMTELADSTGLVYDKDALFKGLLEREETASTAVGGGAAFLHVKFHDEYLVSESFLALGRTNRPVFFGAPDDEGTDIFFLINCTDRRLHLHVLARLCLLAHGTTLLADLRAAPDAAAMLETLKSAEKNLLGSLRR